MDEIRKHDRRIHLREVFALRRIILQFLWTGSIIGILSGIGFSVSNFLTGLTLIAAGWAIHWYLAWGTASKNLFVHQRFRAMWDDCSERLDAFQQAVSKLGKNGVADLYELPQTVDKIANALYLALRKADLIFKEVAESEHVVRRKPSAPSAMPADAQAKALYGLADRNIAEYRAHYSEILAGVHRTEAQAAVFVTTLDSLRLKVLSYRLTGKSPSLDTELFLTGMAEARAQLQAIDTALEELDLGHFPRAVYVPENQMPKDQSFSDADLKGMDETILPSFLKESGVAPGPIDPSPGSGGSNQPPTPPPFRPAAGLSETSPHGPFGGPLGNSHASQYEEGQENA
jgi:hypothetical protein